MIRIKTFVFNPFQVNTYLIYDQAGNCVIFDGCCYSKQEFELFFDFIIDNSLKPLALLNTHGHVDHLTGTRRICEKYSIGFHIHKDDKFLLDGAVEYGKFFGFNIEDPPEPASWLVDGETFIAGEMEISVFHSPGHSPGSLVFYVKQAGILITGDVLFAGSIGRTDLPGGNYGQLINSIRSRILVLPSETIVYPGHGRETTIGNEKAFNPFLNRSS